MKKYIALLNSEYLRDTQIYCGTLDEDDIHQSENWQDFIPNHFIGIYDASSLREVRKQAARDMSIHEDMIVVVEEQVKTVQKEDCFLGQANIYEYLEKKEENKYA